MLNRPLQIIIIELRNLQKTILGLFFSFIFPLITMYFTINSLPVEQQVIAIQQYFPVSLALGIAPLAFLTFPASISKEYENDVFLRYKLFDIDLIMVFISKVALYFLLMLFQICLISIFGILIFGLTFPSFEITSGFFILYIISSIPMFLIGVIITIITKNNMMVQSIGLTIMFSFLILSNAMMPVHNLPIIVEKFKFLIPTNDIIQYLGSYWNGTEINFTLLYSKIFCLYKCIIDYDKNQFEEGKIIEIGEKYMNTKLRNSAILKKRLDIINNMTSSSLISTPISTYQNKICDYSLSDLFLLNYKKIFLVMTFLPESMKAVGL